MKKLVLVLGVLAAAVGISALATPGSGRADQGGNSYAIGLWGDLPYSVRQADVGVPNLIADMNSQPPRVHRPRRRPEERQRAASATTPSTSRRSASSTR